MQGKICYFLRQSDKPINLKFAQARKISFLFVLFSLFCQDTTLSYGELTPGLLHLWKSTVELVYAPMLKENEDWGALKDPKVSHMMFLLDAFTEYLVQVRTEFIEQIDDFVAALGRQIGSLKGEVFHRF